MAEEVIEKRINNSEFTEEQGGSGFDIMEWVFYFLRHWYLFVIGLILSLGAAYLRNRSWLPSYQTTGTIMIEENKSGNYMASQQAFMQGFGVESGFRNMNNQVIMLKSYDLISRVVDSLPFLKVDYISQGNFKTRNLYTASPIIIDAEYVSPEAYSILFKINLKQNGEFEITVDDDKRFSSLKVKGKYNQPLQHNLFFINVKNVTGIYENTELYFRFRDKESLVNDFMRLTPHFKQEGSSVLELSLDSETPDRDIDFINKLMEVSLIENLERKNATASKTMKFIDEQLGIVAQSLSQSESQMTTFRQANKIMSMSEHSVGIASKAEKFDEQINELHLKETYFDYLTKYIKTNLSEGAIIAPLSLGINEPLLMSLVQQINDLQAKRSEISPKNMFYAKYTKEIENIKTAITEVTKGIKNSIDLEKIEYNKRLAKVNGEIAQLPKKEMEMISLERKYKMDDSYYTMFLQKRAESEILKASNTPDNVILEKARVITVTNGDTQSKNTRNFLLIGLLIPALFVVAKELMNNTVRSSKDVEKISSFPLIGAVRHTQSSDPLVVAKNPRSAFAEMFRVIRTRVEFIVQRKTNIMIMITSTESGDGKTYFSINLASVYGMISPKTVLVDMDIRKPSVNQRFNVLQANGVSNYLIGQCELDEVIMKLPGVEFDILPGGTVPPNPGELIRSQKLVDMFDELRKRYDFIIVDTSPIGIVTDAYSLASMSDVNLFVVRNEKTNKGFYKRLTNQLKQDKIPHTYTVMNDVLTDGKRYSKYNSYGYKSYSYGSSYGNYGYSYGNYGYGYGKSYGYGYGYGYTSRRKRREEASKYYKYYDDDSAI